MEANSAKDSEQQLDPFAIMRQYMADLQERAKKDVNCVHILIFYYGFLFVQKP